MGIIIMGDLRQSSWGTSSHESLPSWETSDSHHGGPQHTIHCHLEGLQHISHYHHEELQHISHYHYGGLLRHSSWRTSARQSRLKRYQQLSLSHDGKQQASNQYVKKGIRTYPFYIMKP